MILIFLLAVTPFSADRVEIVKESGESVVHLIGHVVIEDEKTLITCAEAHLHEAQHYVVLINDVRIKDKNGEIHARYALYNFKEKKGYLRGAVSLLRTDQTIEAESLYYSGQDERIEMFQNVRVVDEKNNVHATGGQGWYDLNDDVGYLVDVPVLEIHRDDREPITVHAQTFKLNTDHEEFYGFDAVVANIDSITVYCDTFLYDVAADTGAMAKPVIIEKKNELRGVVGRFSMKDKTIESLTVHQGWSQYYTEEGSQNVVEGDVIRIIFLEGKASRIIVEGQPRGVLQLKRAPEDVGD
jgi:hypothetical protein